MTAAASGGWWSLAKSALVPQFTKTGIATKSCNSQDVQSHHRWLLPCLTVPQPRAAGNTYQGRHESRAGHTRHFVNNRLLHIALNGLQHGTLQGKGNNSWYGKAVRSVKGDAKVWKAEWKVRWGKVGKSEGHRAAPWEKQHLHQWSDRVLSQQGLGNCHPSQSCLWLSWENRKLSIWHPWASAHSSQVHTQCTQSSRQPASRLNAKQAAAGLRQIPLGWEDRRKRPVLRSQAHQQVAWAPVHQVRLQHIHIPLRHLSFLLNTYSCPFPRVLESETIYEGLGVHHIKALQTGFRLSPLQTLCCQAPDSQQGISLGLSAIQEWLTEGTLFPDEVVFCVATGEVNPTCWKPWEVCQDFSKHFKAFRQELKKKPLQKG